jgi:hypothetical protein
VVACMITVEQYQTVLFQALYFCHSKNNLFLKISVMFKVKLKEFQVIDRLFNHFPQ